MFARSLSVPRRAVLASLCVLSFLASAPVTTAGAASAEHAQALATCAAHDLAVITAIEAHGAAKTVSGDTLLEAFLTVMRARAVCREGRVDAAEVLYDSATARLRAESKGQ